MKPEDYNYSTWNPGSESFEDFASMAPQVTSRAPSFPVEDLLNWLFLIAPMITPKWR